MSLFAIANMSGAAYRAAVNAALQSLAGVNAGLSEPSDLYAYMLWLETPASGRKLLWMRNSANSAWIGLGEYNAGVLGPDFFTVAQDTPDMTVYVQAGKIPTASRTVVSHAAQSSATLSAPGSNSWKVLICIDRETGDVSAVYGTAAASPADPEIPDGQIPVARVTIATGTTAITDAMIADLRGVVMFHAAVQDPRQTVEIFDDFVGARIDTANNMLASVLGWYANPGGTAAAIDNTEPSFSVGANPGVLTLDTGTDTSGVCYLAADASTVGSPGASVELGAGRVEVETLVRLEDLPSSGQDYELRFGLVDDLTAISTCDETVQMLIRDHNDTDWKVLTRSAATGSVTTPSVATVSTAADTWTRLRMVINAAGTQVDFYVGDTLMHSATTNIPVGAGKSMRPFLKLTKSAGTTARKVYCDYFRIRYALTARR